MEILSKLFGSLTKVKLMRLFVFNPDRAYDLKEVSQRVKSNLNTVRRELVDLTKASLLRQVSFNKSIEVKKAGKKVIVHKKIRGYRLNNQFPYLRSLKILLLEIVPFTQSEMVKRLNKAGKIKALITAGAFAQDPDSRLDLLIVGDKLKQNIITREIKTIESELGKELKYVVLESPEFKYRLSVYDKLIRDIFDFPHKVVLDLLGIHYDL